MCLGYFSVPFNHIENIVRKDQNAAMKQLPQERSYVVAKANPLITKSRYSLTLQQQKILLYFISRIKPTDEIGSTYEMEIKDFIKICGYEESGIYYQLIKKDIKELADTSSWIEIEKGNEVLFRWIDRAEINKQRGLLRVSFHSTVAPYLFALRKCYTQYSLYDVLNLHHKYAIRLYEYFASMKFRGGFSITIDELRKRIDAEGYKKFSHFKDRILEPAISDVNTYTDLWIEYELKKTGRSFTDITFSIRLKTDEEMIRTRILTAGKLNPDTRKIFKKVKREFEEYKEIREEIENRKKEWAILEEEQNAESQGVYRTLLDDKPISNQMDIDDYIKEEKQQSVVLHTVIFYNSVK